MFLDSRPLSYPGSAALVALAAAAFALGAASATVVQTASGTQRRVAAAAAVAQAPAAAPVPDTPGSAATYPAEVMRVFDGDTFEARVRVWPGLEITTKVRLRGIDAPELRAGCAEERRKAEAARNALSALLAPGRVAIGQVSLDKYGGRVVADASARGTASVGEALLAAGHARRYGGGRRTGWC
jgi:endonuclease YncB( thermonuclease family)